MTLICPHCKHELINNISIGDEPVDMDGRPTLCKYCGEISITENKRLRKLTEEDILLIKQAGFWETISCHSEIVKHNLKRKNGQQ